jgi:hypothetical protein
MGEREKPSHEARHPDGGPTPEHAQWVRDHPSIGSSAFPEYPDDEARRGSSRGALPNGNPWRAESADDVPGPAPREGVDLTPDELASVAALNDAPGDVGSVTSGAVAEAERALAADPDLARRDIRVAGEGVGLVVRGHVASHGERERALAIVAAVAGVAWVEDCLEVLSEIRPDG